MKNREVDLLSYIGDVFLEVQSIETLLFNDWCFWNMLGTVWGVVQVVTHRRSSTQAGNWSC